MTSSATAAPFKLSLGTKRAAPATKSSAKPHSAFGDDHDGDNDDANQGNQITTFDPNAKQKPAPPRVIQGIPNRDWREESRRKRQKSGIPREAQAQAQGHTAEEAQDVIRDERPAYGLTFAPRAVDEANGATATEPKSPQSSAEQSKALPKPKTADEEALDALLGNRSMSNNTVIAPPSPSQNEDDAFQSDFRSAPPPTTAEQYEATPVEGFGAALLRGYLNPGETLESRIEDHAKAIKEPGRDKGNAPKKRPGLLGIGAKESGLGVELGAWGKAGRGGKGQNKTEPGYNPLVRKNRNTGEVITEDELKGKMEAQNEASSSHNSPRPDRKDRVRGGGSERKHNRSERHYDSEEGDRRHRRDQDRHGESRRERSSSADKHHRRRRHDETDAERRERKHREHNKHDRDRDGHTNSHGSSRGDDRLDRDSDRRNRNRDRRH